MENEVQIIVKNYGIHHFKKGTTILQIIEILKIKNRKDIIAGLINNKLVDLHWYCNHNCELDFIYTATDIGLKIYRHTATHILALAIYNLYKKDILKIGPSINNNFYFDLAHKKEITSSVIKEIKNEFTNIIKKNYPIKIEFMGKGEAIKFYKRKKLPEKARLIEFLNVDSIKFYSINGFKEMCLGPLAPYTSSIKSFKFIKYPPGFLLQFPVAENNKLKLKPLKTPKKLSKVFLETRGWYEEQGVSNATELNEIILNKKLSELINVAEAYHEKKLAQIADEITKRKEQIKLVLIAGPSSSGKTTFSKRLSIQLKVNGLKPIALSLDNYFVDRENTPRDENGNYDFESLEALDLKLLNKHLHMLLNGKTITVPKFDFKRGKRKKDGTPLKIEKGQIVIIEGIHGLNEKLSASIPAKNKFKIYVSALIQLRISNFHRIATTDLRLIRRIVRDSIFRGNSPEDTIKMWPLVRRGEEKNIFPFQEDADVIFNSALIYEIPILKQYAEKLLLSIPYKRKEYQEAKRLLNLLAFFLPASSKNIPGISILREFIGGSSFHY